MKPHPPPNEILPTAELTDRPSMSGNLFSINLFVVAFLFTGAVLAWLTWSTYDLYTHDTIFKEQSWRAGELRNKIVHLDEVLTMSARMAAATGDDDAASGRPGHYSLHENGKTAASDTGVNDWC